MLPRKLSLNFFGFILSFLMAVCVRGAEDSGLILFTLNNISDYRVSYILTPVDENGESEGDAAIIRGALQVGQIWETRLSKDTIYHVKITIAYEGEDPDFFDMSTDLPENLCQPCNLTPVTAYSGIINGIGIALKGLILASSAYRSSEISYTFNPQTLKTTSIGMRLVIRNIRDFWRSGIAFDLEEFSAIRRGIVVVGVSQN